MYESFGQDDPRKMPSHLFSGALYIDYPTAVRADTSQQHFTVCPRCWYVSATFRCSRCDRPFLFTMDEQRLWYEELKFFIDSLPRKCTECRKTLRELKALKQEYDRDVISTLSNSATIEEKTRLVAVIEALEKSGMSLADQIEENRRVLVAQIERLRPPGTT